MPILNGRKCTSFVPERGIKQGDPISPYIFFLGMEYLTKLIKDQIQENNWRPFTIKNKNIAISYLFFADDVLLSCKENDRNIQAIFEVLKIFSTISEMKNKLTTQNPMSGSLKKSIMIPLISAI